MEYVKVNPLHLIQNLPYDVGSDSILFGLLEASVNLESRFTTPNRLAPWNCHDPAAWTMVEANTKAHPDAPATPRDSVLGGSSKKATSLSAVSGLMVC